MARDYAEYLAAHVLNEKQLISYRSLSRALKVHSNLAKQMLFEFHSKQNAKRPGSVHATYLITGTKYPAASSRTNGTNTQDDDDTVMQSSPPLPSSSAPVHDEEDEEEPTPVRSVLLAKEEHLAKAKGTFESITGIHIYSLQANGLSDIQTLTECNRKIAADYSSEDPQVIWKTYGTIQNPNAKRRTTRVAPPAAPIKPAVSKPAAAAPVKPAPAVTNAAPKPQQSSRAASNLAAPKSEPQAKPAASKKDASALFKSFAKSKPKAKQEESQGSTAASQDTKDEPMGGFSDDDADDLAPEEEIEPVNAPTGKSKREREADLEAMMEKEDEPMDDAPETPAEEPQEENAIDKPKPEAEPKETVTVENGRRRGRRRVMKKKTVKDEDGYLVTREEAAWESFSEDEPAPKKLKPSVTNSKPAGGNKKAAKPGQGNIMSFFGKK